MPMDVAHTSHPALLGASIGGRTKGKIVVEPEMGGLLKKCLPDMTGSCTPEFILAVVARRRPALDQDHQHFSPVSV